jgi:hypothetical protein
MYLPAHTFYLHRPLRTMLVRSVVVREVAFPGRLINLIIIPAIWKTYTPFLRSRDFARPFFRSRYFARPPFFRSPNVDILDPYMRAPHTIRPHLRAEVSIRLRCPALIAGERAVDSEGLRVELHVGRDTLEIIYSPACSRAASRGSPSPP